MQKLDKENLPSHFTLRDKKVLMANTSVPNYLSLGTHSQSVIPHIEVKDNTNLYFYNSISHVS